MRAGCTIPEGSIGRRSESSFSFDRVDTLGSLVFPIQLKPEVSVVGTPYLLVDPFGIPDENQDVDLGPQGEQRHGDTAISERDDAVLFSLSQCPNRRECCDVRGQLPFTLFEVLVSELLFRVLAQDAVPDGKLRRA